MRQFKAYGLLALLCPILTGCMVGPDFKSPAPPETRQYTYNKLPGKTDSIGKSGYAGNTQTLLKGRDLQSDWWTLFKSKELNGLIEKGITNNPDLAAAKAALQQSKETLNAQIGNLLFPAITADISAERARISSLAFGEAGPSSVFNVINSGASVSYLLDIFGGSRRQIEALHAQVDYQQYQVLAAYLTLTTNITTSAVTIAALDSQIRTTRALISEQEKELSIIKKQKRLGGASLSSVLKQQTLVAQTRATLPPLEKNLAQSQHALAVLVGDLPSQHKPLKLTLDSLVLPRQIPVSIPSRLVKQRPDIQAAEAVLHASSAQIGVATANLFPQINLTAGFGWAGQSLNNYFSPGNNFWSWGAALSQPIFRAGALFAERRAAIAAYQQSLAQYRLAVLQGFQNVADSLRALDLDAKAFKEQRKAEMAAKSSYYLVKRQYKLGGASYLSLLQAQQAYQQTSINRIQAQAARYTDTAALFAALGGGWWNKKKTEHYK